MDSWLQEQRDIQARREAVMDALSPAGSIGWLRAQARLVRYKPGWRFEILDGRDPPTISYAHLRTSIGDDLPQLVITVRDENRRWRGLIRIPTPDLHGDAFLEIPSPLPPGLEDQQVGFHAPIWPETDTVAAFMDQVRHAIDSVELDLVKKWLKHGD